ncbi:neuromedin-U receptor 1-like isoform X3 [Tigriopus californicus]|uniref:neuromedin-U receptor 1-like isoform X3 n=1 Tax=Tigriopus californicus TaxID=6832 RepID=UPI0027DA177D|nr:neuromedin-U receptor 1-like isoform X3 [Tigriopus californicus]
MYSTSVTIFNFTELPLLPSDNGSLDYGADSGQKDQSNPVWGMPMFENNALANLSDAEYLAMVLGPKNVGLPLLIPITIIYVLIFISGVIGNVAVCLVIIKNKSMHTATNYYLFSLAISDLMILVLGLPNDLAIYWQQYPWMLGEAMCKGRSLVSEMTSYSSVLIIVSFSMERYLAICHPLYSHTMSGFKRAVRIICLVWLISLVSAIPYAIFTRLNYIDRPLNSGNYLEESAFCALLDDNIYPKNYPVHQLSSFLFFIFPMGILVILYIRMGFRIRQTSEIQRNLPRSNTQNHHNNHHGGGGGNNGTHPPGSSGSFTDRMDRHTAGSRRTVLRMLSAVVFAFFLCWAPFHAQRLSYVYFKESMIFRTINEYLYYVSGFLYYLSATVNPILYNLMSLKYRHAFRQTLCGKGTSSRRRRPGTINRSYTFRSTTRTVVENNGSDWDPRMRNEPRGSFRKRSQDGAAQRFSFHKSNCSEGNHLNSSTSDKSSVAPGGGLGRRARSYPDRSEFQHAMHLANATFSDIIEEDSQVSNSGGGGLRLSQPSLVSPCCSLPLEKTADIKFTIGQPGAPPLINFVAQGRCSLSRSRSTSPKPVTVDSCCQTTGESDGFLMKCRCFPVPNDSGDKQRCGGKCNEWVTPGESVLLDEVGAVGQLPLPLEQANAFEGVVKDDDDQDSGNGSVSELHALFDRESQARLNGVQHTKA